jgi:hypothetical protein
MQSIDLGPVLPETASMAFGTPSYGFSPEVRNDLRDAVDGILANAPVTRWREASHAPSRTIPARLPMTMAASIAATLAYCHVKVPAPMAGGRDRL